MPRMVTLFPGTTWSQRYLRQKEKGLSQKHFIFIIRKEDNTVPLALPVTVELQVARHLPVRNSIRRFLQAERLEVNTNAAVWDDEVGVHRALHPSRILTNRKKMIFNKTGSKYRQICVQYERCFCRFSMILMLILTCYTCVAGRNPAGLEAAGYWG